MKNWLKDNKAVFALAIIGVVCFFIYGFLAFSAPEEIFNSPDETANYVFSRNLAEGSMKIPEPDNVKVQGMIAPRSTIVNANGDIVPGYFLGMPILLGNLAGLFGCVVIPFATPFVSAIAPIFFYFGLKRIFEKNVALISAILLYFHPIFIYYSAKSLMPNALFIDFIVISLSLILCSGPAKGYKSYFKALPLIFYFLSGVTLGLALCIRLSEIFWVFFIYFVLFVFKIKKVNWPGLILGLIGLGLAVLPTLHFNKELYGDYLKFGYNTRLLGMALQNSGRNIWNYLKPFFSLTFLFPFGLKLAASVKIFINYAWRFLGWYYIFIVPGFVSFFVYLFHNKKIFWRKLVYSFTVAAVSAYLILYYGSYVFYDHVDITKITIGTSYLRYWLPIFVFTLPFVAYGLYAVWRVLEKRKIKAKAIAAVLFFLVLNLFVFDLVFAETDESIFAVKKNLEKYAEIRKKVLHITPENAIIITDRSDKIFFPKRKVVVFLGNYAIFDLTKKIIDSRPIYYYTHYPPADMNYLNEKKIKQNLNFVLKEKINDFYLYKLTENE